MKFWKYISSIGVSRIHNAQDIRMGQVTNRFFAATIFVQIAYIIAFYFLETSLLFNAMIFCFLGTLPLYFLVNEGKHKVAAILLNLALILGQTFFSIVVSGSNTEMFLLIFSIFGFAMIKEKWIGVLIFLLAFVCFFFAHYVTYHSFFYNKVDESLGNIIYVFNSVSVFMVALYLIYHLRSTNDEYEKSILDQKELLEIQHFRVAESHKMIRESLSYAKRIQSAILPPSRIIKASLHKSFVLYKPKDIVAGDFYWFEQIGERIYFAVADCTGHGVPGAMVSVICNNALNRSVREHGLLKPSEILDQTRKLVIQEFELSEESMNDGMDIALCCLEGNTIEYAGANNPLWIIRNGEIIEFRGDRQPIGSYMKMDEFTNHEVSLQKNDFVYVFSDGYVDQFGGKQGKKMMRKNFKELLLEVCLLPIDEQRNKLDEAFENWKGDFGQVDDVCVLGVQI